MIRIALALIILLTSTAVAEDDPRAGDRAALRVLLTEVTAALGSGDPARLGPCLAPGFVLTFADQHRFDDLAALDAYQRRLRAERGIDRIDFAPAIDGPARFVGADVAIATGTSTDIFVGVDGDGTTITSRWTATLERTAQGWRISALQAGVDLLDNPILERIKRTFSWIACGAAVVGLLVGLLIGRLVARRRA